MKNICSRSCRGTMPRRVTPKAYIFFTTRTQRVCTSRKSPSGVVVVKGMFQQGYWNERKGKKKRNRTSLHQKIRCNQINDNQKQRQTETEATRESVLLSLARQQASTKRRDEVSSKQRWLATNYPPLRATLHVTSALAEQRSGLPTGREREI